MMEPTLSLAQIKASVRIEEVIGRRGLKLTANAGGQRLVGCCPFHQYDDTPSFNVYVQTQRFHCFGCGADGDVIDFVEQYDVCSRREAMARLSTAPNLLPLPTFRLETSRKMRPVQPVPFPGSEETSGQANHSALLTAVQQSYHQALLANEAMQAFLLQSRGITREGIMRAGLGYAHDQALSTVLKGDIAGQKEARDIGLLSTTMKERLRHRLVIPECNTDGLCRWMIGRVLPTERNNAKGESERLKYLGISLSKPLLGYGLALRQLQENRIPIRAIIVVEGALDYIFPVQWNLPVLCVALVGTHASRKQLADLLELQRLTGGIPLLLALDADERGRQATCMLKAKLASSDQPVGELEPIAGAKDFGDLGTQPDGRDLLARCIAAALLTLEEGEVDS